MWYILLLLVFAMTLLLMVFAKDGFINSELNAYQKTIVEPWLHRLVALKYSYN